jgi:hypothetical protein
MTRMIRHGFIARAGSAAARLLGAINLRGR